MSKNSPFNGSRNRNNLRVPSASATQGEFCIENMSPNKIHVRVIPASYKIPNQRGFLFYYYYYHGYLG